MESKKYSREFKLEAVKLVKERVIAILHAARDLHLNHNMLRRWLKEHDSDPKHAFPGLRLRTSGGHQYLSAANLWCKLGADVTWPTILPSTFDHIPNGWAAAKLRP
jgi:hypothetical protein